MSSALVQGPPTFLGQEHESGPSRAAPRRTYGRQRAATPEEAVTSIFVPAGGTTSPAKGLLDRWSNAGTSWRTSLALLDPASSDPPASEDTDTVKQAPHARLTDFAAIRSEGDRPAESETEDEADEDVDMAAIKRQMEKMRRQARGEVVESDPEQSPSPAITVPVLALDATSSLTSLPTSSPKAPHVPGPSKSPKKRPTREEETLPVRKLGSSSNRRAKVVTTESESEDEGDITIQKPPSPSPSATNEPSSPSPRRKLRLSRATTSRSPTPRRHRSTSAEPLSDSELPSVADILATATESKARARAQEAERPFDIKEIEGLFSDEEEAPAPSEARLTKKQKSKGLNKKDMKLLQSGMAETRRNRALEITRPEAKQLPMSSWLKQAADLLSLAKAQAAPVKSETPGLTFGHSSSPKTSPAQTTPQDDMGICVPSSSQRKLAPLASADSIKISSGPTSSPTPHMGSGLRHGTIAPVSPEHEDGSDDDAPLPTAMAIFDEIERKKQKAVERDAKLAKLAAIKAMALSKGARKAMANEDDDFEILPVFIGADGKPNISSEFVKRHGPDAKAVLAKNGLTPVLSRSRQEHLRRAGKSNKQRETATESYIEFAGQALKHSEMKRANGGAVPAGQKKGRDIAISHKDLNHAIFSKHAGQIVELQRKKEENFGKGRSLPQRRIVDVDAYIQASNQQQEVKDEESEDDDDFVPDAEDGSDGDAENDEEVLYSGAESEADAPEDAGSATEDGISNGEDKENQEQDIEIDDEQVMSMVRRKAQRSKRVAFDSDDEQAMTPTLPSAHQPFGEIPVGNNITGAATSSLDLDLAGFGEGGGSPGFSQLFEETQAGTADITDAFADLREKAPFDMIAANAFLPNVDISETQAARDNALIAAEVDAAMDDVVPQVTQPKKRYLNDAGFFTQTKPATYVLPPTLEGDSQMTPARSNLAGSSDFSMPDVPLSETQRNDMLSSNAKDASVAQIPFASSPTQQDGALRRLKRRTSFSGELDGHTPEDNGNSSSPVKVKAPRNAMNQLMRGAKHEARKAAIKSNLVDEQAEESDEDGGWAPLGGSDDDDDGDLDDGYVAELVDDAQIDEEEKKRQDELAAAKAREIEAADDAKREAEAKKITEGQYRTKRRGRDFLSDDEDEEGSSRKRLSKKQRKLRDLGREDGLQRLDGEENVFKLAYEEDLVSDTDSIDDEPEQRVRQYSPQEETPIEGDVWKAVRARARMNRGKDLSREDDFLDAELGLNGGGMRSKPKPAAYEGDTDGDDDELMYDSPEEESQFAIKRSLRTSNSIAMDEHGVTQRVMVSRSTESYASFVQEESQMTRRVGGFGGTSVVVNGPSTMRNLNAQMGSKRGDQRQKVAPARQASNSSKASLLASRGNRFG